MDKSTLRRADLVTSTILFVFSIWVFIMSIQYVVTTIERGKHWFESSGLFPMIISFLLCLCSITLFGKAKKDGAKFDFLTGEKIKGLAATRKFRVAIIVIGMLATYIFALMLPGRQYEIASFIYLFIAMLIFQERNKKNIINSVIIAGVSTAVLSFCFGQLAMVPLP